MVSGVEWPRFYPYGLQPSDPTDDAGHLIFAREPNQWGLIVTQNNNLPLTPPTPIVTALLMFGTLGAQPAPQLVPTVRDFISFGPNYDFIIDGYYRNSQLSSEAEDSYGQVLSILPTGPQIQCTIGDFTDFMAPVGGLVNLMNFSIETTAQYNAPRVFARKWSIRLHGSNQTVVEW